ncbi:hypothetical protein ACJ41O_001638 [Fusarium nematophilum]
MDREAGRVSPVPSPRILNDAAVSSSANPLAGVPESHRRLRIRLFSSGAYACEPERGAPLPSGFDAGDLAGAFNNSFHGTHGEKRSLDWEPIGSGYVGATSVLSLLWLAAVSHWTLLALARKLHDNWRWLPRLLPPLLGTGLAKAMSLFVLQHRRRCLNRLNNGRRDKTKLGNAYFHDLLFLRCIILLVICPLISIPVFYSVSLDSVKLVADVLVPRSWDEILSNTNGTFPSRISANPPISVPDVGMPPSLPRSFEPWILPDASFPQDAMPPLVLDGELKTAMYGVNRSHGIHRPVRVKHRAWGERLVLQRNASWPLSSNNILNLWLDCERLQVDRTRADRGKGSRVNITIEATQGACRATIALRGEILAPDKRQSLRASLDRHAALLLDLLASAEKDSKAYDDLQASYEKLKEYISWLETEREIASFAPVWEPSTSAQNCVGTFIFAATSDPAVRTTVNLQSWPIEVALCKMKYKTIPTVGSVTAETSDFLLDYPLKVSAPRTSSNRFTFDQLDLDKPGRKLGEEAAQKLDSAIRERMHEMAFSGQWHPSELLKYQLSSPAGVESSQNESSNAILYGAVLFLSAVSHRLADALSLRLDETTTRVPSYSLFSYPLQLPESYRIRERPRSAEQLTVLARGLLQETWWFQLLLCLSLIAATVLFLPFCNSENYASSGVPWDVSSIAARIAMLHNSRLPAIFASEPHSASYIHILQSLEIGFWSDTDDGKSLTWKVDSLLRQPEAQPKPPDSSETWKRHSLKSIPWYAGSTMAAVVMVFVAATTALMWLTSRSLDSSSTLRESARWTPFILGYRPYIKETFRVTLTLKILPYIAMYFSSFIWWEDLTHFYKMRQPWAGLYRPGHSRNNITLDYYSCWLPHLRALKNKHWVILILATGSAANLLLPVCLASSHHPDWAKEASVKVKAKRDHVWSYTYSNEISDVSMNSALEAVLQSVLNSSALPEWSSPRLALLPVNLSTSEPHDVLESGAWEFETEFVRAELACSRVAVDTEYDELVFRDMRVVTNMTLHLRSHESFLDGTSSVTLSPCFSRNYTRISGPGTDIPNVRGLPRQQYYGHCAQWGFAPAVAESGKPAPRWFIASHFGEVELPVSTGQNMEFNHEIAPLGQAQRHRSRAWVCEPRVYNGTGTVQLLSMDNGNRLDMADIHQFHTHSESLLKKSDLGLRFSRALSEAVRNISTSERGLHSNPRLWSDFFMGDFLSFMAFRWATHHGIYLDERNYPQVASHVFATIFAAAIQETGLINAPGTPDVSVSPVVWRYRHVFQGPSCIYLLLVALAHLLVALYYGIGLRFRKEYLFPLDVEILENSWYFLFQSSLVGRIGRIGNPESGSQKDFFAKVDALKLECFFGRPSRDDPYSEARVDVASMLEEPPRQNRQKRSQRTPIFIQIPDSSSSSSSDSESSDDVPLAPHDRGSRRRHSRRWEFRSPTENVGSASSGGDHDPPQLSEMDILNNSEDTASNANPPRTGFWNTPAILNTSFRSAGYGLLNRRQYPITYMTQGYNSIMAALRALPMPPTSLPSERHQPDDESALELLQSLPCTRDLPEPGELASSLQSQPVGSGDAQRHTGNGGDCFIRNNDGDSETNGLLLEDNTPLEIGPDHPDDPLSDVAKTQPVGSLQTYLPLFMIDEVADSSLEEDDG